MLININKYFPAVPYYDLNNEAGSVLNEEFDFVIIGAGIAGIVLAVSLYKKGKKVLLIETGKFKEDEFYQNLNQVVQSGKNLVNATWGRKRVIGGTGTAWGGQSLPFSSIDFQERNWVENSGWPINYLDLVPFYNEANRFMNIDDLDYDFDIFTLLRLHKTSFDDKLINYHFSKWAPEPDLSRLYKVLLRQHIPVLFNANVVAVDIDENGKADSISIKNLNCDTFNLKVKQLLIATGAIEASRLLLMSRNRVDRGIGSSSGWLGRCFMDHPCITVGEIDTKDPIKLQKVFNTHRYSGRNYSLRLSLSEEIQRNYQLLNASAGVMFYYPENVINPYDTLRNIFRLKNIGQLPIILKNADAYLNTLSFLIKHKLLYKHNAIPKLVFMLEQEPVRESFIDLSNHYDYFGNAKARINWTISKKTWHTLIYAINLVNKELQRLEIGEVKIADGINLNNGEWSDLLSDVNHHMGGTRMSNFQHEGVVNSDLCVWGHENIFVCSSSVFPTGSHSNPTLTLMALCLRLVNKLTSNNI